MKRYDQLALWAVILIVAARIISVMTDVLIGHVYPSLAGNISYLQRIAVLSGAPLLLLLNIAIGTWLFRESKKDGHAPWVWFLFGLVFQLTAVAVFYLLRIYRLLKKEEQGGEPAA